MDHIRSIGRSMFLSFRFFWNIAWNIYTYIYIQKSICSKCWDHFPRGCCNGPANCCIYGFSPGYALSELGWFVGFTGLFLFFNHSILSVHKLKTLARSFGCWDHWQVMLEIEEFKTLIGTWFGCLTNIILIHFVDDIFPFNYWLLLGQGEQPNIWHQRS